MASRLSQTLDTPIMIEHVTDAEHLLYHYTKSSVALEHILKNRTLKLGSYTTTNDPKETKSWQFGLGTNENRELCAYKMSEESAWLSGKLKGRIRLVCFSRDSGPLSGIHINDIFRRGYCKPRMWVQYAEKHAGVCLVFDKTRLSAVIEKQVASSHRVLAGPVEYVDRGIVQDLNEDQQYMINIDVLEDVGRDAYPDLHFKTHFKRLFFEKMTDWRDECEWRWIVVSNSDQDIYVAFGNSLVGIMFGEDTQEEIIHGVMEATRSWGLRYMGLKWKNCSPWYDYGNLRYTHGIKNFP